MTPKHRTADKSSFPIWFHHAILGYPVAVFIACVLTFALAAISLGRSPESSSEIVSSNWLAMVLYRISEWMLILYPFAACGAVLAPLTDSGWRWPTRLLKLALNVMVWGVLFWFLKADPFEIIVVLSRR